MLIQGMEKLLDTDLSLALPQSGPGAILKQYRLKQLQSLDNVSAYLGACRTLLEAMEKDDFLHPMFKNKQEIKAYYLKYAQYLNISGEEIAKLFSIAYGEALEKNAQLQGSASPNFVKYLRWILAISVILGGFELLYWSYHKPVYTAPIPLLSDNQSILDTMVQDMVMSDLQAEEMERDIVIYALG